MIDRIHRPSTAEMSRYVQAGRPVIVTGLTDDWKAYKEWSPEFFMTHAPDLEVVVESWESRAGSGAAEAFLTQMRKQNIRLEDFVRDAVLAKNASGDLYLAQFPIFDVLPALRDHLGPVEPYMGIPGAYPRFLRERLQRKPSFWMGAPGTKSTLHFDVLHNFFVQIRGRKRFTLFSPDDSRFLYYPSFDLPLLHFSPINVHKPDTDKYPLFKEARSETFVVEAGELLFLPCMWWHDVRTEETSISLNFWWWSPAVWLGTRKHRSLQLWKRLRDAFKRAPRQLNA